MKKLILLFAVAVFSTTAFAQISGGGDGSTPPPATHCYYMQRAVMYQCFWTSSTRMTADATLLNGTRVSPAGVIKTTEGKTSQLLDGQCILMDGTVGSYPRLHPAPPAAK